MEREKVTAPSTFCDLLSFCTGLLGCLDPQWVLRFGEGRKRKCNSHVLRFPSPPPDYVNRCLPHISVFSAEKTPASKYMLRQRSLRLEKHQQHLPPSATFHMLSLLSQPQTIGLLAGFAQCASTVEPLRQGCWAEIQPKCFYKSFPRYQNTEIQRSHLRSR